MAEARLRWWQEEREGNEQQVAAKAAASLVMPVAESPQELRDIGEELEQEARLRAIEAERQKAQSIALHYDAVVMRKRAKREATRTLIVQSVIAVILTALVVNVGSSLEVVLLTAFLAFAMASMRAALDFIPYVQAKRRVTNGNDPAFLLSPDGLRIHTYAHDSSLFPWQDILNIAIKKIGRDRWIRIDLRPEGEQADWKSRIVWLRAEELPVTPETFMARVAAYEAARIN